MSPAPAALRLLVDPAGEATWNMAVDEALLQLGQEPTLRLYGWWPHAVSLGYFQRAADFADLPAGTPLVRRLTGGGAIHHGEELTFALAVDASALPTDIAASYRLLHDAAIRALTDVGLASERLDHGEPQQARPQQRWCFAAPGRDDVVTARGKLLGSAQRRIARPRPRILHHGSLVLRRPSLTPFVAAVDDAVTIDPTMTSRLRHCLAARVADALGCDLATGALSDAESQLARRLQRDRYADRGFTHRS